MPYLFTMLALLSTFKSTRAPLDTFTSSQHFEELVLSIAIVLDAIEAREQKGKENAKTGRHRRKVGIRLWRFLREVGQIIRSLAILTGIAATGRIAPYAQLTSHEVDPESGPFCGVDRPYNRRIAPAQTPRKAERGRWRLTEWARPRGGEPGAYLWTVLLVLILCRMPSRHSTQLTS